jgi:hypothetical protein
VINADGPSANPLYARRGKKEKAHQDRKFAATANIQTTWHLQMAGEGL